MSILIERTPVEIRIERLSHAGGLPLPAYQSADAAGLDLCAAIPEGEPIKLAPGERIAVPTGFAIELPRGFEGQVRPRSGLALRQGLTCLNAPGTIDADYRGEILVILVNHGQEPVRLQRGMRVAQLVVAPISQVSLVETGNLSTTERDQGGFGSTGISTNDE